MIDFLSNANDFLLRQINKLNKFVYCRANYCMEPKEFELQQQHEPEEAQLFIKYANKVNGEQ